MKIEVGKSYRTRNGKKAFVSAINGSIADFKIEGEPWDCCVFAGTGRGNRDYESDHENDLIAEWTDEPTTTNPFLKTVTETRIVDGSYVFESASAEVTIEAGHNSVLIQTDCFYDKQSLAELARILAEISEAMA